MSTPPGVQPDQITPDDFGTWAKKLDVSEDQIKEAVDQVGSKAADVEMHLKGSRSTTNAERVDEVGGT